MGRPRGCNGARCSTFQALASVSTFCSEAVPLRAKKVGSEGGAKHMKEGEAGVAEMCEQYQAGDPSKMQDGPSKCCKNTVAAPALPHLKASTAVRCAALQPSTACVSLAGSQIVSHLQFMIQA